MQAHVAPACANFSRNCWSACRRRSSGSETGVSQLGVLIGQTHYLLDLQQAGEIVSVGAITKVPLTQDWYLGLANIRGNLTSVIDLARFQGFDLTAIDKESRIVAFAAGLSFNSGLLVSRVMGLRNVGEMEPRADSAVGAAPWSARQFVDHESRIWTATRFVFDRAGPQVFACWPIGFSRS